MTAPLVEDDLDRWFSGLSQADKQHIKQTFIARPISDLQKQIDQLISSVAERHGLQLKIVTRRVFDEKCR